MKTTTPVAPHINDCTRPVIFLGSSMTIGKFRDVCQLNDIHVHGIIDSDYYGNTEQYRNIPVIDSEACFDDPEKLEYYRNNFNFFIATNWTPDPEPWCEHNRAKRKRYMKLIDDLNLSCVSLVDPYARVSSDVKIGKGVFIDAHVMIDPDATIGDFSTVYWNSIVGHDTVMTRNVTIQRDCILTSRTRAEDDVYLGLAVKALRIGATFGAGTFIHEGIYIRRGTIPGEVVSMHSKNQKRVVAYPVIE